MLRIVSDADYSLKYLVKLQILILRGFYSKEICSSFRLPPMLSRTSLEKVARGSLVVRCQQKHAHYAYALYALHWTTLLL